MSLLISHDLNTLSLYKRNVCKHFLAEIHQKFKQKLSISSGCNLRKHVEAYLIPSSFQEFHKFSQI